MADEYGAVRSNEFRVKDFDAFKAYVEQFTWSNEGELILEQLPSGKVIMAWYDQYPSPVPRVYVEAEDEVQEIEVGSEMYAELMHTLGSFLETNERLFLMAIGNTKLRYTRCEWVLISPDGDYTHSGVSTDMPIEDIEAFVNGEL